MNQVSIPEAWARVPVSEVNDHKSSNVKPSDYPEEIFELYSVPIFPTGKPEFVKGSEIGSSKQHVEPGDLLLCKINPRINRVWFVSEKKEYRQIASSEWIVIRQPLMDVGYLRRYFSEYKFRDLLCSEVTGVGGSLTRAQPKKVATYPVNVAPLNEQTRIANKLDELLAQVDTIKARVDAIPAILKRFRQSVLAAAVSGKLTAGWRADNCITLKDWNEVTFNELCREITVGFVGKMKDQYCESGIPFLRSQNVRAFRFSAKNLLYVSEEFHQEIYKSRLEAGDLAIVRSGAPGTTCVIPESLGVANCSDLVIARPKDSLNAHFACIFMNSEVGQSHVASKQVGVAQQHFNVGSMKKTVINLPGVEEQKQIVQCVEQFFAFADQVEQRVTDAQSRIDSLTQSILAKTFRGELVPQDPNDEPASELLARIQKEREEAAALLKAAKESTKKPAKKSARKPRLKKAASE